jgi:hypothetical protein
MQRRMVFAVLLFMGALAPAQQFGGERSQQALNPEISVLAELWGTYDDSAHTSDAQLHEVEVAVQSALDPYSRLKVIAGIAQDPVTGDYKLDIEEGYVTWTGLMNGISLDVGKFKQPFGVYNRWHPHALPTLDYPLYIRKFFGDEGLASTGVSAEALFSGLGTSTFTLQAVTHDGKNSALAHYKSYWDLTPDTYIEGGLSYFSEKPRTYGADLTILNEPHAQANYSHLQFHAEWGRRDRAQGWLALLEKQFTAKYLIGLSYERAEEVPDPSMVTKSWAGIFTYWQSEYVRIRLHLIDERQSWTGRPDRKAVLQLSVAAGPHKHDSY